MAAITSGIEAKAFERGRQSVLEQRKHEGFSNYETWCVALFIDNDEPAYHYWKVQTKAVSGDRIDRAHALAAQIKAEFEDGRPEGFTNSSGVVVAEGMWHDLLSAALSEVNWYEIAQHLLEE